MSSCDRLQCDTSIPQGFSIVSQNQQFYTTLQEDGNLVIYKDGHEQLWTSNSNGKGEGPYYLRMQMDGNLCLYSSEDLAIWASNTRNIGTPPYQVKMKDDGDFCIYDTNGTCIWQTNTFQK